MPTPRKPASNAIETEAKIRVASFPAVKRRIRSAGGRLVSPRTLETNTLFDSAAGSLQAAGKSFRVRRYGATGSITLKGVAQVEGGMKSRVELESEVSDPETMARILASVGFGPRFRYEKCREVWNLGAAVICLDETPIGRFVEIEGTADAIHRAASVLGFAEERFLSASYPALWFGAGRRGPMVFAGPVRTRKATGRPRRRAQA